MLNQLKVETFATNIQRKSKSAPYNPCVFCQGEHSNDKCEKYKFLPECKQKLSSRGRCFHLYRMPIQKSVWYYCEKRGITIEPFALRSMGTNMNKEYKILLSPLRKGIMDF